MADNTQTLTDGEFTIRARDASNGELVVTVEVSPGGTPSTDSPAFQRVSGASLKIENSTPPDTATLDHPRFFAPRDTATLEEEAEATPGGSPDSNGAELRDELPVTLIP